MLTRRLVVGFGEAMRVLCKRIHTNLAKKSSLSLRRYITIPYQSLGTKLKAGFRFYLLKLSHAEARKVKGKAVKHLCKPSVIQSI